MFCIIAFIVLSILGIFSATNRALAKEAFDCVLRRVTLRPCNTGFDEKMKARILGSVITRSETAARILNRNFELLAWTFFLLFLASGIWTARGLFLFYQTGSCNGFNSTSSFCVFDPKGENNQVSQVSETCSVDQAQRATTGLTLQGVDLTGFPVINSSGSDKIVFVGCYACDYTRKVYPEILRLVEKTGASFTFLEYPVKEGSDLDARYGYCAYQQNPDQYWKLNDLLFQADKTALDDEAFLKTAASSAGLNADQLSACANDPRTQESVKKQLDEIVKTNFYGTPTVFINDKSLVGPKPYRVYAIQLDGLLYWLK